MAPLVAVFDSPPNKCWFHSCHERFDVLLIQIIIKISIGRKYGHSQADWLRAVTRQRAARLHVIHPWSGVQGLDTIAAPRIEAGRRLIIGAYGRYCEQKGFDVLIDAARLLDPDHFMIVLGGFGPDEAMLHQRAAGLRHVRFAGKIERPADFLNLVDAVAIPSRWEPFGQVAAEAKLAGRPIVVANVDGLPEQATGCGIVADCSTPALLADALRGWSAEHLLAMGTHGRTAMQDAEATRVDAWLRLIDDQAD